MTKSVPRVHSIPELHDFIARRQPCVLIVPPTLRLPCQGKGEDECLDGVGESTGGGWSTPSRFVHAIRRGMSRPIQVKVRRSPSGSYFDPGDDFWTIVRASLSDKANLAEFVQSNWINRGKGVHYSVQQGQQQDAQTRGEEYSHFTTQGIMISGTEVHAYRDGHVNPLWAALADELGLLVPQRSTNEQESKAAVTAIDATNNGDDDAKEEEEEEGKSTGGETVRYGRTETPALTLMETRFLPKGAKGGLEATLRTVGLWVSGQGVQSLLHYDETGDHNLNFQLAGKKRVTLFPPSDWPHLSTFLAMGLLPFSTYFSLLRGMEMGMDVEENNNNNNNNNNNKSEEKRRAGQGSRRKGVSGEERHRPSQEGPTERDSLLPDCHPQIAMVHPGELLFIPSCWYHFVEHLDNFNLNATYWFAASPSTSFTSSSSSASSSSSSSSSSLFSSRWPGWSCRDGFVILRLALAILFALIISTFLPTRLVQQLFPPSPPCRTLSSSTPPPPLSTPSSSSSSSSSSISATSKPIPDNRYSLFCT